MAFITLIKDGKKTDVTKALYKQIDGLKEYSNNLKFIHIQRKDKDTKELESKVNFLLEDATKLYLLAEEKESIFVKLSKAKDGHPVITRLLDRELEIDEEIEAVTEELNEKRYSLLKRDADASDKDYNKKFDLHIEPLYKKLLEKIVDENSFKILAKMVEENEEADYSAVVTAVTIAKRTTENEKGN
jgi:hypothetical protein